MQQARGEFGDENSQWQIFLLGQDDTYVFPDLRNADKLKCWILIQVMRVSTVSDIWNKWSNIYIRTLTSSLVWALWHGLDVTTCV